MTSSTRTITERYGTFGWEEFLETKDGLLAELDSAKLKARIALHRPRTDSL